MRNVDLFATLVSLLVACAAGCSDTAGTRSGDDAAGSATAPPPELISACKVIATARCDVAKTCCKDATKRLACEPDAVETCAEGFKSAWNALSAKRATLSQAAVDACVQTLKAGDKTCMPPDVDSNQTSCGAIIEDPAAAQTPCNADVIGLPCAGAKGVCVGGQGTKAPQCLLRVAVDEACDPAPCAIGTRCLPASSGGEPKTCREPGTSGDPCVSTDDCRDPLTCGVSGTCGPGLERGKICTGPGTCARGFACDDTKGRCVVQVEQGQACLAHRHCKDGLVCTGLSLVGSCVAQSAIGAACSGDNQCAVGLFCDTKLSTCTPQTSDGTPCNTSDACGALLYCDLQDKTCKGLPGEGQACAFSERQCLPGLTCYQPSKKDRTCVKRRKKGEKCSQHNNCEPGLGCDFSTATCVELPANGAKCFDSMYCKAGYCDFDNQTCKAWLANGKTCSGGHECSPESACVGSKVDNLVCKKLPAKGDTCLLACQPGLFCGTKKLPGTCAPVICLK